MKYLMLVLLGRREHGRPDRARSRLTLRTKRASPGWTTSRRGAVGSPATNWLRRAGLAPSAFRDGKAIVTDGPFIESKEAIGGFDIIEWRQPGGGRGDRGWTPRRPDRDDRGSDRSGGTDHGPRLKQARGPPPHVRRTFALTCASVLWPDVLGRVSLDQNLDGRLGARSPGPRARRPGAGRLRCRPASRRARGGYPASMSTCRRQPFRPSTGRCRSAR